MATSTTLLVRASARTLGTAAAPRVSWGAALAPAPAAFRAVDGGFPLRGRVRFPQSLQRRLQRGRQFGRVGVLQGHHAEQPGRRLHVQGGNDGLQARDVGGRLVEDQGVGRPVRHQTAVLGNQRRQQAAHGVGLGMSQADEAGLEGVACRRRRGAGVLLRGGQRLVPDGGGRDDLDDLALRHDGEAVDLEDRQEHPVRLLDADRRRGNERHPAAHVAVQQEVLAGELAHQADDVDHLHVAEIEMDLVVALWRRDPVRCRVVVQPRPTTFFRPCEQQDCGQQPSENGELGHVRRILCAAARGASP